MTEETNVQKKKVLPWWAWTIIGIGALALVAAVFWAATLLKGGKATPTPTLTATPQPTKPAETVWSDPDAFDAVTAQEYPLGDRESWTYGQAWDNADAASVIHFAVAPGIVIRVRGYLGTRWQIWGELPRTRIEEMALEVQTRDNLPNKPLIVIIDSFNDPDIDRLPEGWNVEAFPHASLP